ncbi:MAG: hypothetical protein JXX14_12785 [Deltaproteobacteria bacterium]|nr:hypothetical protein [Deltaproteobacteria bacterium]
MKFYTVFKSMMVLCLFSALSGCGTESERGNTAVDPAQEPVAIILNPKGNLPGMDIAAVLTPKADSLKTAEALSLAFHTARAACAESLIKPNEKIHSIEGITVFEGKMSVKPSGESDNGLSCLTSKLDGQTLKGFKDMTHMMDLQIKLRSAQ